jgi:hypothetical protein
MTTKKSKKKATIKLRKARILKAEKHPAKPNVTVVQAAHVEMEIEDAPPLPEEPLVDPIVFDDNGIADTPEEKLTTWQKWCRIWS